MKHVGAGRRDVHVDEIRRGGGGLGIVCHLLQQVADLSGGEIEATALIEVRDFGLSGARRHIGNDPGFVVVIRNNLDGLDAVRVELVDLASKVGMTCLT
jgi:hypothetical protein